jgi:hypothetical protein
MQGLTWIQIILLVPWVETHSMEQSPSEANISTAGQEIPLFDGTRKVHYCSQRHLSLSWAISIQSTPFHPISLISTLNYPHICACLFKMGSSLHVSSPKLCMHLSSPSHMPLAPPHLIHFDLVTRIIFYEQYQSSYADFFSLLLLFLS